uniref:TTF-type domain-containing protein n=1 Tax=Kalanchoe fedtschenkoi TaxID=63787 RepID=A0A7N0THM9_KALFE
MKDDNEDSDSIHPLSSRASIENLNDDDNKSLSSHIDIFDPRCWDALDSKMIDVLVIKGPQRDKSIQKGLKNKFGRRFVSDLYVRILDNGEVQDRDWLVNSKELDKVFCFCCKIFKKGYVKGGLVNEGYADWTHVAVRLQEHEVGLEHKKNWATWYELQKDHWKNVLLRIICIVKFLAKHSLAIRGTKERLYENNNGNFLGLIEMLAEFDPIIQEHVRRITNDDIHIHYLSHKIQNELIFLFASSVRSEIVKKVRQAKYFSVILDCTPDVSHQEQMSLILRYVDLTSSFVVIEESFLGFINVNDIKGKARDFFGTIQRIYTIFAHSTKRWQILKDNSYLRSSISQERFNGLGLLAIENDYLEKVAHEDLVEDFVSKNSRRLLLFT